MLFLYLIKALHVLFLSICGGVVLFMIAVYWDAIAKDIAKVYHRMFPGDKWRV